MERARREGRPWWERGVVYQIYPRSYQDSDGDGVGDLPGILRRLDHLAWLGVDAVWLSPIYPSPMADFGYDISDYTAVDPLYGTLDDFDRLLEEAHDRGLRLIMDLVPNHTSVEHPWFRESRSSRDNPKRDWYLWRDPAPDGGPPNNWRSVFGGPGWEYDPTTGQYYYHAFLPEQPDLNWRNPEVRGAMYDVMRFWLERGIDGFRVDVIWHLIKDARFRDNPDNPRYRPDQPPYQAHLPEYSADRPEVHEVIEEMRDVVESYGEKVLIGEVYLPIQRLVTYYGSRGEGVHIPFNFLLIEEPWDARRLDAAIRTYEGFVPPTGWPSWVLSNHDKHRVATRAGEAQARVAAMLLLTLRGTPTVYYGDELGMPDVDVPSHMIQDPYGINVPQADVGRDGARTPMQWDASAHAGFTDGSPWLPVAGDAAERNVAALRADPRSILHLHRRLLALRRQEDALAVGSFSPLPAQGSLLAYVRKAADRHLLVALNLGGEPGELALPRATLHGRVLLATGLDREGERVDGGLHLRGNEGLILEMDG